jgi:tripartite-type tricarboxylate transporter receptor subunit TctC
MKRFFAAAAVMAAAVTSFSAHAQNTGDWPQKPIRLIIAFGPGGGTDIVGRIIQQPLQDKLGQPVVVENRPGAGGIIGADAVARADKDGYTLGIMTNGHVIAGVLTNTPKYDTETAFETIGMIATAGLAIAARPDFQANTVKDLIAMAKANPGKINFASPGFGGTQHFTGELFKQLSGTDMVHVPFRTSPEIISAVLGKQVDLLFDTIPAVLGQVQSGQLKALAVTGPTRAPSLPNVPTVIESGLPAYDVTTWYGLIAPKGLPPAVTAKLNKTLNEVLAMPDVKDKIAKAGLDTRTSTSTEFGSYVVSEVKRWDGVREGAKIPKQ